MTPDRTALLAEAESLLRSTPFTKEAASKIDSLLQLADRSVDKTEMRKSVMGARDRELGRTVEVAATTPVDQEFRNYFFAADESMARQLAQQRAQSVGTDSAGGFIAPQAIADRVEVMLKATDGLFDAATLFEPPRGTSVNYPVIEDTGHSAAIVTEGTISTTGPDITFAAVAFGKVATYRSGVVGVSLELDQDSSNFDLGGLIANSVAPAFARGVGAAFTATLLTSASSGVTAASATAVAPDELYTLIDSVDEAYQANASWLMRRSTLTTLRKLKASTGGSYLFPEARDADGYPTLLGYRIYVSPSMGALSTGAKPISFGDHSKFIRRQIANSFTVRRYVERFAELGQVAFEGFMRTDGGLAKSATTMPVKYLTMA